MLRDGIVPNLPEIPTFDIVNGSLIKDLSSRLQLQSDVNDSRHDVVKSVADALLSVIPSWENRQTLDLLNNVIARGTDDQFSSLRFNQIRSTDDLEVAYDRIFYWFKQFTPVMHQDTILGIPLDMLPRFYGLLKALTNGDPANNEDGGFLDRLINYDDVLELLEQDIHLHPSRRRASWGTELSNKLFNVNLEETARGRRSTIIDRTYDLDIIPELFPDPIVALQSKVKLRLNPRNAENVVWEKNSGSAEGKAVKLFDKPLGAIGKNVKLPVPINLLTPPIW
eukprot:GHVH01010090.1.p1 GENE.GHVH01010090.1~~GHVH01010090.1.p1  ORF type:complete len:281 (+),score=36.83 GHVH01010090.1:66-908(+)